MECRWELGRFVRFQKNIEQGGHISDYLASHWLASATSSRKVKNLCDKNESVECRRMIKKETNDFSWKI